MIRRRTILLAAGTALVPAAVRAQSARRLARVGYLTGGSAESDARLFGAFRRGLRDEGYVEGESLVVEPRFAAGAFERLAELAADLAGREVDVIVAGGEYEAGAAQLATRTVPIVMHSPDAVGSGLVASLAHPGGNITGMSDVHGELLAKRLEFLRELTPGSANFAVIFNSQTPSHPLAVAALRASTESAGLGLLMLDIRQAADVDRALDALARQRPAGLIVVADKLIGGQASRIGQFAVAQRLPAIGTHRGFVEDRCFLLSYGANLDALYRRLAVYVDRILKGARPADLPIEQPTQLEFVIGLRTAREMGITIPQALLARADEVIE